MRETLTKGSIFPMLLVSLFLGLLTFSGCKNPDKWEGDYQGYFEVRGHRRIPKQRVRVQVRADEKTSSGLTVSNQVSVRVINDQGKVLSLIPVQLKGATRMVINLSTLGFHSVQVKQEGTCFESHGEEEIRLCQSGADFLFNVFTAQGDVLLSLAALRVSDRQMPRFETAKRISFSEGRLRIIQSNFESQIQSEKQLSARLQARKALLDLLPQVSISAVAGAVLGYAGSIVDASGNLLPFLFPSRWFNAYQSRWLASAQNDALLLLRADLIFQFETLAFSLRHLQAAQDSYDKALNEVKEIQDIVQTRLLFASDTHAAREELDLAILKMISDRRALMQAQQSALIGVAQSLGFQNPNAVLSIESYPFWVDPEKPLDVDFDKIGQEALNRSLELRQLESLTYAAEIGVTNEFFSWFDPSSNGLGAGQGTAIKIAKTELRQLVIQREQLTSRLLGAVQEIRNSVYSFHELYPLNKKKVEISTLRVERLRKEILSDGSTDPKELLEAIEARLEAETGLVSMESGYSLLLARLRRLLFDKGYHCLSTACPPEDLSPEAVSRSVLFLVP